MPNETVPEILQRRHPAQSIRVGIEAVIAVLVALVAWNANQLTSDVERILERVRHIEIAAAGNSQRFEAMERQISSLVNANERQWSELRELRKERR